ncbi:MAG: hypothetical protein RL748_1736 [Pseudomonadota bacterium]
MAENPAQAARENSVEYSLAQLLQRANQVLARVEQLLPAPAADAAHIDWNAATAWRWRKGGVLRPVRHPATLNFADLQHVDAQREQIERNTRQFVSGRPANNVLLTGARGTGKSSLIKACLQQFAAQGLRLIEVDKADLVDLPDMVELLADRPERFIIFCDDLSFESGEPGYKALKVVLDGSIATASNNVLIYASSNRRHLMPESQRDNASYTHDDDGDLHPGETVEEKISLSERFGLWLTFYPFKQDDYLDIVSHWLRHFGCQDGMQEGDAARAEALRWALQRGSRSGRVAFQFAKDWAGQQLLQDEQ